MRRAPGFSLVELVVIIAIAAILAALAIPRFTQPEIDAVWFREQVKAAVRYAQREAVAQRRLVYVEVQTHRLRLCYDPGCTQILRQMTDREYVLDAPSGIALGPVGTFSFNGLGQPSGGVTLTVAGGTITVTPETGYVK